MRAKTIHESKGFVIPIEKWEYFKDILVRKYPDNSNRDLGLDIITSIRDNNLYCTKEQYDKLNQIISDINKPVDDEINYNKPVINKKYFTTIPYPALDLFYMRIINDLNQSDYNFFKHIIDVIKNRYKKLNKIDNNADVTEREYNLLMNLKTGLIKQKDYSTKN